MMGDVIIYQRDESINIATECVSCEQLTKEDFPEDIQVILHTTAELICGPNKSQLDEREWEKKGRKKWKEGRDQFLWELKKYISAVRNSGGGIVFVHIKEIETTDWCLDYFHELVDNRLNGMIEDGSLFVTVYNKDWQSVRDDNNGIVVINVSPSATVVTLDFKTKIPLDNSIVDPSSAAIVKLLTEDFEFSAKEATIRGLSDNKLRESRHVQVKTFFDDRDVLLDNIDKFVVYIWKDLRLREYLTSFSKLEGGGSFYLGIKEKKKVYDKYTTKELKLSGFEFRQNKSVFSEKLKEKVERETVVLEKDIDGIKFIRRNDLINIEFHSVSNENSGLQREILEVAVAGVKGIVFYDKEGPEAHEIGDKNSVHRMSREQWLKLVQEPCCNTNGSCAN